MNHRFVRQRPRSGKCRLTSIYGRLLIAFPLNLRPPSPGNQSGYTTTMRQMETVIRTLEKEGLRSKVKVLIGGAPTSKEFAVQIGADAYCKDAFEAVSCLKHLKELRVSA